MNEIAPATPRQRVSELVRAYAQREGVSISGVWRRLYKVFRNRTAVDWVGDAFKADSGVLAWIEERGRAVDLMQVARELLDEEEA